MKIKISDQVLVQDVDADLVLLNIETGRYFGLDPIGHRVWRLLDEFADTDEVFKALKRGYAVDEATLRKDLDELVNQLIDARLIEAVV